MSAAKTVAWGVLVSGMLAGNLRADALSSFNGDNEWVFFNSAGRVAPRLSYATSFSPGATATNANVSSAPVFTHPDVTSPAPAPAAVVSYSNPSPTFTNVTNTTALTPVFNSNVPTGGAASQTADAYLNFGGSNYLESSSLTTGGIQPWYTSPSVTKFFNGATPDVQQQANFENLVLQDVQHTYAISNLFPKLTLDPNTPSNHMMSIVSGASYGPNSNAIGITDVGHNGFGFIDKFSYATSIEQLAMAVAKNMSHELMHAFGVGTHPDTTGNYIDAGTASWNLLTNADSSFSPAAASLIAATNFGGSSSSTSSSFQTIDGQQEILAAPVPEPMTVTIWAVGLAGLALYGRSRRPALGA
jgi:hypothetical protein